MSIQNTHQPTALSSLRKRWAVYALFCLLLLGGGAVLLYAFWSPGIAARWLAPAAAAMLYPLWVLWRGLRLNYRQGEENVLLPALGPGNALTLLRGAMVGALTGFLFLPSPLGWLAWIPWLLYTLSDISDYLDGTLARRSGHATRLGAVLDMSFDGIGVLAATLLAIKYGQAPWWYISVALARYVFVAGLWLRRRRGLPVYDLPPSFSRRAFAGLQMGLLAAILLPIFTPPGTYIAATLFALPFLVGFTRDWLIASGTIQTGDGTSAWADSPLARWLPIGLRLAVAGLAAWQMIWPMTDLLAWLSLLQMGLAVLILIGAAGRTAAIGGLFLTGVAQVFAPLGNGQIILIIAYTAILFLGTGTYSLWKPEDRLIYRNMGEIQGAR